MKTVQFEAICPFEIGDEIRDVTGKIHEITDIVCAHYVRANEIVFYYELDHSKKYAPIKILEVRG